MAGKASSFSKGQIVIRTQGQTTCVDHRHTPLDWFCKTCTDVICAKCISTTHTGHTFVQLSDETPNIKYRIRKFVDETESKKLVQIQQEIKANEDSLKKHLDHFDGVAAKVKKQGEKLKEELNLLISQTLSQMKYLEEEHTKRYMTYRAELETRLEALKKQLNVCKESLQTGSDIELFDVASGLDTYSILPPKPAFGTAQFSPNIYPNQSLERAFGMVEITFPNKLAEHSESSADTAKSPGQKPQHPLSKALSAKSVQTLGARYGDRTGWASKPPQWESKGQHWVFHGEYNQTMKDLVNLTKAQIDGKPQGTVLPEAKLLNTWKPPCDITSICPGSDEGMWTCDNSDNVTLINNEGRIEKQRLNPVSVRDICTSPITHNLWACSHIDNSVTEMSSGTFTFRFNTSDTPRCICVTRDGHVLVGMKNKIVKYDSDGKHVDGLIKTRYGKPIVYTPWKMSQCPVSENIAVVDRDRAIDGGEDKPHILVMNKQLQQIFRYGRPQHNSVHGSRPFEPYDVTYDRLGKLVFADRDNFSVHLLGSDGQYLRCLQNGIGAAWFVSVDQKDVLWAVFSYGGKQVNLLQYD